MSLKLTLSILVCGALLAALSCGKDNPLKPLGLGFKLGFIPERGGMVSSIAFNSPSHLTPDKRLECKLLEFVPGGSVSH